MAECEENYSPGPWKGYDFSDARRVYDTGRSYSSASSDDKVLDKPAPQNVVPDTLTTECKSPVIVVVDGTGSMGDFPETIFKKLPLLDDCAKDYLDDVEISYAMIGDAGSDRYGLQVQPFSKGLAMIDSLNKLVIERGGGGNETESYDLAALYYLQNCHMPKAVNKPILIFVADEGVYPLVDKDWAKQWAKTEFKGKMTDKQLFEKLHEKFSVYCIRKRYNTTGEEAMTGADLRMHKQWQELVGADRIAILQDPKRVVDVMLGLLANETDKQGFFKKELTHRQTPDQVKQVMASMISIGKICGTDGRPDPADAKKGLSIANRPANSVPKGSKSLLE